MKNALHNRFTPRGCETVHPRTKEYPDFRSGSSLQKIKKKRADKA